MKSFSKSFLCLIVLFILCQIKVTSAETANLNSKVEFEYHLEIQFDQYNTQDCTDIDCESEDDGFRIADFDGTLKGYTGPYSLVFLDVKLGYGEGSTTIANTLRPVSFNTSGHDDDKINQVVFGLSYKQLEVTYGKHELKTNSFGPSSNNFLSFSLSGFDDDRIEGFSYEVEDSHYISSSASFNSSVYADSYDINFVIGAGPRGSNETRLSLNHDFIFETTIPEFDNVVFSFATRSLTNPNSKKDLDSYGVKINVFNSNGTEFTVGLTENDFGRYKEIAFSYIWMYRYRFTIGGTDFNTGSGGASLPNSATISDANFLFASATYAISELFQIFAEYSEFDASELEIENVLVGLKMSF